MEELDEIAGYSVSIPWIFFFRISSRKNKKWRALRDTVEPPFQIIEGTLGEMKGSELSTKSVLDEFLLAVFTGRLGRVPENEAID